MFIQLLLKEFPEYRQCWLDAPTDKVEWFKFMLQTSLVFKLSGSSSFDSNLDMYSDTRFSNNTVDMMKENYSADISTGFYTMYSMGNFEFQNIEGEKKLVKLLGEGGGERIISDNVPRAKAFLEKNKMTSSESKKP